MPSQTFESVKYSSLDYSGGINKSLAAWQTCANQPLDKKVPKKYATSHNEMKKGEEKNKNYFVPECSWWTTAVHTDGALAQTLDSCCWQMDTVFQRKEIDLTPSAINCWEANLSFMTNSALPFSRGHTWQCFFFSILFKTGQIVTSSLDGRGICRFVFYFILLF